MTQKLPHPSIDPDDPWADDILGRKKFGVMLADMIQGISQPFVMSVKGEWGSGKSVFLRRLEAELELRAPRIPVIFVDAWKYDYYEDPLYALISAVELRLAKENEQDAASAGRKLFGAAGKVVAPLAKIAGATMDMVSGGAVTTLAEGIGELGDALLRANEGKRNAHEELCNELAAARDSLLRHRKKEIKKREAEKKVVVIIDELDRCRPDYAVRLLERVKHFFDLPGYLFVVAVDGQNLHEAVKTLYGPQFDGERYLRKFFDLETYLPSHSTRSFNRLLRKSFHVMEELPILESSWKNESVNLVRNGAWSADDQKAWALVEASAFFEVIAEALRLKLRDQAQAFSTLNVIVSALGDEHDFMPVAAALIVCLRHFDYATYEAWRVDGKVPNASDHQTPGKFLDLIVKASPHAAEPVTDYLKFAVVGDRQGIDAYINKLAHAGRQPSGAVVRRIEGSHRPSVEVMKRSYQCVFDISGMLERETNA